MVEFIHRVKSLLTTTQVLIPKATLNPLRNIYNYMITRKVIQQCQKDFGNKKCIQQFALLYSQFREANKKRDKVRCFRLLSIDYYDKWKDNNFNTYNYVYDIKIKRGRKVKEQFGEYYQFAIELKHLDQITNQIIKKIHVVERKLDDQERIRRWYFCYYQN